MSYTSSRLNIPAIAPSILTADFGRLQTQIEEAEAAGVDMIHLDVMDGVFVPNISFGPLVVKAVRRITSLPLDVHLMIDEPERYIDAFASAGADLISIHVESTPHIHRALQQIHAHGVEAGVALNPATPLSAVAEVLSAADLVLLMTVNPGFGGQSFITEMVDKISRMRRMVDLREGNHARIEVDGGINAETISQARAAGAEIFVCGSSVYSAQRSVKESVELLRTSLSD